MTIGSMICGIIGGVLGLLVGLFGYGLGAIASASGATGAGLLQAVSIAIPVAGIVGGAIVHASGVAAGLLMAASTVGIASIFGLNFFTVVPFILTAIGAVLAFASASENRVPAATSTTGQELFARIGFGFIAAAIAVVTVHEGIIYGLTQAGWIRGTAWGMQPIPPWGVPRLINNMFWGGLWGALLALIYNRLPGNAAWLKGLAYGLLIVVVSNWILLPLIKGQVFGQPNQVLFAGWNPQRMLMSTIIVGGYGLALGVIYGLIRPRDAA